MRATASSPEGLRLMEYLVTRAATLGPAELRARVQAAAAELDGSLAGVTDHDARRMPRPGEWSLAQVVDHVAQTTVRMAEELHHVVAGRRPPGPPVYEALTSGAGRRAPWAELLDGLRASNAAFDAALAEAAAPDGPRGIPGAEGPTVRAILVVNRAGTDPAAAVSDTPPLELFEAELTWREYALVQRLHLLDHRTQARTLRAAL